MNVRTAKAAKPRVPGRPVLVRISVGIEAADDLIADLDQALSAI